MAKYTVTNGRVLHGGFLYVEGDTIELDDSFAKYLAQYISSDKQPDAKQTQSDEKHNDKAQSTDEQSDVDYDEYTIAELKQIVEEQNLEVEPTGKNGREIKSDYVRAIEQSN